METRNEFFAKLCLLTNLPNDIEHECPICTDDFVDPVEVCPKHIFCQECVTKWLTRRKRNTCPTCRRVLFNPDEVDRWPFDADRVRVLAQVMERSRLLTNNFDEYGYSGWVLSDVHRAAAEANNYLAQTHHAPITEGTAVIDSSVLGPHLIAMGNMLRGFAAATNRGYLYPYGEQWKLILEHYWKFLSHMDGQSFEGNDVVHMTQDFRLATVMSLRVDHVDVHPGGFFEADASLQSPSGDLDFLFDYIRFQCVKTFERRVEERKAHQRAQRDALQSETSTLGRAMRWAGQRLFNVV